MPKNKPKPFIVIEALDAGGSQTQTDLLTARLKKAGYKTLSLHFPQEDRATGRMIYDKFLLHKNKRPFSRREQALLYIQDFFSRTEDITTATAQGRVVVTDRFCTSTFAYQTMGLTGKEWQAMYSWIWWLCYENKPMLLKPDLVLFLDTPVAVSMKRLKGKNRDFFETSAKLTAVRNAYLKVAKKQAWRILPSVDNHGQERTREDLHQEVWNHVRKLLS